MRIAYLILAHQHPALVARLARLLLQGQAIVAIHYDLNAGAKPLEELRSLLGDAGDRVLYAERVAVAWGEWSMVKATLNGLAAIERSGAKVDYVHLMSGADYPIRPLSDFREFLAKSDGSEFIECVNINERQWVRIGPEHERYLYRHYFNWRTSPRLSHRSWNLQKKLGLQRTMPKGLTPHLGSQWWTLTWATAKMVLDAGRDPRLEGFFRTAAIPDEMFIQTIVAARVPREKIWGHCLTLYQFTDYGVPVVFHNDHGDYLARQPFFFARKISPQASRLRDTLDRLATGAAPAESFPKEMFGKVSDEYETERIASRVPRFGRRLVSYQKDNWRGDLAELETPALVIAGASLEEIRFVSDIVAATGAFTCHGRLFGRQTIEFADGAERFAGYSRSDLALRDRSRTSFLSDVVLSSHPEHCAFLLPWKEDEALQHVLIHTAAMQHLVVRGNVFRAFVESRARPTGPGEAINPREFDRFYAAYRRYYDVQIWAEHAKTKGHLATEIVLTEDDWLTKLAEALQRSLQARSGSLRFDRVITRELVLARAERLSDPSRLVANATWLTTKCIEERFRDGHVRVLAESAQPRTGSQSESVGQLGSEA